MAQPRRSPAAEVDAAMVTAAATSGAGVDMGDKEQSVDGERMQRIWSLCFIGRRSTNVDEIEAQFTAIMAAIG